MTQYYLYTHAICLPDCLLLSIPCSFVVFSLERIGIAAVAAVAVLVFEIAYEYLFYETSTVNGEVPNKGQHQPLRLYSLHKKHRVIDNRQRFGNNSNKNVIQLYILLIHKYRQNIWEKGRLMIYRS